MKNIIKALKKNSDVSNYSIIESKQFSLEQYYVMHALEVSREINVTEYHVTVYHEYELNGVKYLGSANFTVSHKMSSKELDELVEDAVASSKLVKNKYYDLVKGDTKKSFKGKSLDIDPYEGLLQIADIYHSACHDEVKINALEIYYTKKDIHLVNSLGVDYKKSTNSIFVEAIPSTYKLEKTEVYKSFNYDSFDFDLIKQDANDSINDAIARENATKYTGPNKLNIILRNEEVSELFYSLINEYNYASVYKKQNRKNIGDELENNVIGDKLNISLIKGSKTNGFDADGVLLNDQEIVKDGVITSYYGNNKFAKYLGLEPTGNLPVLKANTGKLTIDKLFKSGTLEIISLSGIQIEMYSDYIGGEIRLAIYNDGTNIYPVSGISFQGKISEVLKDLKLSKEKTSLINYTGPKFVLLKDLEIL